MLDRLRARIRAADGPTVEKPITELGNAPPPAKAKADAGQLPEDYAKQLADVFKLSGRSPTADATLGREFDQAIEDAERSSDPALADFAKKIRRRVADKFFRVHSTNPSPAEPLPGHDSI